uniref:Fusion glycoprotein F0 n=1 Tax=Feline morbillivirus TaxID=1170234 RepID=A0A4Y5S445_9MONO|nr:fusion protein [Feline morbillivirus]QDA18238.1 fusion protein [Feline morbillivirus]QDA18244.1 fusion protein [Feline morbillivirus]QDA18250.1 fusion protein [Feline morbillivirus]QDA18256.1 fusion protein [Feline morbillivirus]
MDKIKVMVISSLLLSDITIAQVGWDNLTSIGVISTKQYDYKITTLNTNQLMVIKMIPNISSIINCTKPELIKYRELVSGIIRPINESLELMNSYINMRTGSERFIGAVIAGVALGVATAAQITSGIALHNSIMNKKQIQELRKALSTTNKAIDEIRIAGERTLIAVQGIQDYINNIIIPMQDKLQCDILSSQLSIALLRYYTNILTVFGPSIRDPITSTISIQALSQAFNGNLQALLDGLGYTGRDLRDLLESKAITGQIIHADMTDLFLVLRINYPSITEMQGVTIYELNSITYHIGPEEWYTIMPNFIAVQGFLMSNFDERKCSITKSSILCQQNSIYPMSTEMQRCIKGDIKFCPRSKAIGTLVNRFILTKGNLMANCLGIICRCYTSGQVITQDPNKLITIISQEECREVGVDGIRIMVGPRKLPEIIFNARLEIGVPISLSKLDVGTDLAIASAKLNNSKALLEQSDKILDSMSKLDSINSRITGLVLAIMVIFTIIIIIAWITYKKCRNKNNKFSTSIEPLYIPPSYNSPHSVVKSI